MTERLQQPELEEISAYIRTLKFKPVALGGVDREAVLVSIQELYRLFVQSYGVLAERQAEAERDAEELRTAQAPLEAELSGLRAEKAAMAETIRRQLDNSGKAAELETKYRQREAKLLEDLDLLRQRLQEQELETANRQRQHLRELELAKAGAADKGETLEEIYLDARRSRAELLDRTRQETENLRLAAEAELAAQREAAEAELAEQRAAAERVISEAQEAGAQVVRSAEAAAQDSQRHCELLEAAAQRRVEEAEAEAGRIVAAARASYLRERGRYDGLLAELGALRARTVEDIRRDVAKLNELAFGMTGRGIETDAVNAAGLPRLDEEADVPGAEPEDSAADGQA